MDGILIIDKPAGLTSHDVVARLRGILKTKRIGHTGTLDPFATGVLVMLVGRATRLARFLDKDKKEYEAVVRFGFETDTGDRTGILRSQEVSSLKSQVSSLRSTPIDEIENILKDFRGEIEQTPPMYSAKKVAGKKLYELARQGVEIERQPVKVTIYDLKVIKTPERENTETVYTDDLDLKIETWDLGFKVVCSAGTYIRTLAEDIGRKLGVGAHLAELRRTGAGKFDLSKAVTIERLREIVEAGKLGEIMISMNQTVSHLPEIILSEAAIKDTLNGKRIGLENAELENDQMLRMIDAAENLIAVGFYVKCEKCVQPKLVLI